VSFVKDKSTKRHPIALINHFPESDSAEADFNYYFHRTKITSESQKYTATFVSASRVQM